MKAGEVIAPADVAVLRTEKLLRPGISPDYLGLITGCALAEDIQNGEGARLEQLVNKKR
jgi:sialic acid synthase SpsE